MQTHAGATATALITRHFTTPGVNPLDEVTWKTFQVDQTISKIPTVEAPDFWSENAVNVVAKLYLSQGLEAETSVRAMIRRVADKITDEAIEAGYFDPDEDEAVAFHAELCYILLHQLATFNSPVWFNIGRVDRPQCPSACFLLHVDDNSDSILAWTDDEARIFKAGSGSGANLSLLRASMEPLSTGGIASGPVSFMRMGDAGAGTFKSGGTTRRAAKLVRIDVDHPDIREFVWCKAHEEERIQILREAGVNLDMNDPEGERNLAACTSYQNANNSVGVSDEFMNRATYGSPRKWELTARKTGEVVETVDASTLLDEIAQAAWRCADPGLQFDDTINGWHTTPADGPIRTSNPCSETVLPDVSSCNLASLNLLPFLSDDTLGVRQPHFKIIDFCQTVDVMTVAMDILVEFCELPTDELTRRTKEFRWLGLGYSNLGATVMAQGLAYDSDEARDFAGSVTALHTGRAYHQSALLAERMGAFDGFEANSDAMLKVIDKHMLNLPVAPVRQTEIWRAASKEWHTGNTLGREHGYRNAQTTLLAPTGTTSYQMDCDTTGVEPTFNLVTHKKMAGGGYMKIVNKSVERALRTMVGDPDERERLLALVMADEVDAFMADLDDMNSHREDNFTNIDVFLGANDISSLGHIRMMEAVQPFLSGAISKTVNLSSDASWEDIRACYIEAWRRGIKALAVYRDGSKGAQPHSAKKQAGKIEIMSGTVQASSGPHVVPVSLDEVELMSEEVYRAGQTEIPQAETPNAEDQYEGPVGQERRRLPRDRQMICHKFNVAGFEGYLMMGMYEDGTLGEIFLEDIGKDGSHLRGMTNSWAIGISMGLQYGVPLETFVGKYTHMTFEPNGATENPAIPFSKSMPDYIMRVIAFYFLPEMHEELGILTPDIKARKQAELDAQDEWRKAQEMVEPAESGLEFDPKRVVIRQGLGTFPNPLVGILGSNGNNGASAFSGDVCSNCNMLMRRTGTCLTCPGCFASTGCG